MKKFKTMVFSIVMTAAVLTSGAMAFAQPGYNNQFRGSMMNSGYSSNADYISPIEELSKLTGLTEQEIYEKRADTSLAEIAYNEGVWDEWTDLMLENKKEMLQDRVENGYMTQQQADDMYEQMLERHNEIKENPDFDQTFRNGGGFSGRGFMMNGQRGQGAGLGRGCSNGFNN